MRGLALLNIILNMFLQVVDGILTYYSMTNLNDIELNPFINSLMLKVGIGWAIIMAKTGVLSILILVFIIISKLGEDESYKAVKICIILMSSINVMYIFVVAMTLIDIFTSMY